MLADDAIQTNVRDAERRLARTLAAAGIDAPLRDARLLVAAAIGGTALDLLREPGRPLTPEEARALESYARRRAAREPVSRILGERAFFGRTFHVAPAVLDPRPCSETVIEAALAIADEEGLRARPLRILDIGTGSGCLLLTLLAELERAEGLGTDIGEEALRVAALNAARLELGTRARFARHRYCDGIGATYDLVISNPPYIPSGDIAALEPEVRDYEPRAALDGGTDGLDAFRAIIPALPRVVPRGWALFEVGAGQADEVAALLAGIGPATIRTWTDLGGHRRCVAVKTHF